MSGIALYMTWVRRQKTTPYSTRDHLPTRARWDTSHPTGMASTTWREM